MNDLLMHANDNIQILIVIWANIDMLVMLYLSVYTMFSRRLQIATFINCAMALFMLYFSESLLYGCRFHSARHAPMWLVNMTVKEAVLFSCAASLVIAYASWRIHRWNQNNISEMSIKESVDTLLAGVLVYNRRGRIEIINPKMESLITELYGKPVTNGMHFMQQLQHGISTQGVRFLQMGDHPIVQMKDGHVYTFTGMPLNTGWSDLTEIIASDITEENARMETLREANIRLHKVNEHLIRYNESITEVTRQKEILAARRHIHDSSNVLLLATRHCIEENGSAEEQRRLLEKWRSQLLMQKDSGIQESSPLADIDQAAQSLSMRVIYSGRMSQDKEKVHVIMLAAGECLINAAKHAKANILRVSLSESKVVFTNDGQQPFEDIAEGGGLSMVREALEKIGGRMSVETEDEFRLILEFSDRRVTL